MKTDIPTVAELAKKAGLTRTWACNYPHANVVNRTLRLEITQEVIDSAAACDASRCMIALAVRNKMPDARHFMADRYSIRWSEASNATRYLFPTPAVLSDSIERFDTGGHVDPFTITVTGYAIAYNTHERPWTTPPPAGHKTTAPQHVHGEVKRVQHFYPSATTERYGARMSGHIETIVKE